MIFCPVCSVEILNDPGEGVKECCACGHVFVVAVPAYPDDSYIVL